jgi:uncharacterized RDD family membrane protein YckC
MSNRMTPEDIEIRIWAFIVVIISTMLFIIALGVLWAVAFEEQSMELAPIDGIFLEILKAVAYMSIGTLGGIAGRKIGKVEAKEEAKQEEPQT